VFGDLYLADTHLAEGLDEAGEQTLVAVRRRSALPRDELMRAVRPFETPGRSGERWPPDQL
jgi:hypothetical protein